VSAVRQDGDGRALPARQERPNVSGDLSTVFDAAPMFRRTVVGYDRFQVDTYVRWAEDELATADRERRHLLDRHLHTRAALDEARELLAHSPAGGGFLQASRRIGTMLAAAADEAEGLHADAAAERAAATAEAQRLAAQAAQVLAEAETEAGRVVVAAAAEAAELTAFAGRMVDDAERTVDEARAEAEARLAKVGMIEQRAVEQAAAVRQRAGEDAAEAQLRARAEIVAMLSTAREERRRADAAATAIRERQEREAAARHAAHTAALAAEVAALEQRRSALRAEIDLLGAPVADDAGRFPEQLRRFLERFGRSRYVRTP
jgi:cell division septum initiation protein DivIVA